ncbi:hypothetical protein PENTCL1PPCAC_12058, partial [Pristionchus entomophagus]
GEITARCSGTLTCAPGRILIANNRYVVTNVECSPDSSLGEEVWTGKTSAGDKIAIENAACFITPVSCISLGSFSTRCPRGYVCEPVEIENDQTLVRCRKNDWLTEILWFGLYHKHLWFQDRDHNWQQLNGDLECDPKLGAWIETDPVEKTGVPRSIITDSLFCGSKEVTLHKVNFDLAYLKTAVMAMQICLPIILIFSFLIYKQLRKRANLREMKKYLDEQYEEGQQKMKDIKELEKAKTRQLVARWRQVNGFVVEKNKPIVQTYMRNKKDGKKHSKKRN